MNQRGRYPPGIGNGRGGNFHTNPNFQNRNPNYQQQQYVQRPPMQNQQQQQWLRRNPNATDSPGNEVEKTVQSEVVDSSSQDWKAQLRVPPPDTRYKTEEEIAYPNDPRVPIKVDDNLKQFFRTIELPHDMLDIEKDLQNKCYETCHKHRQKEGVVMAQVYGIALKPMPKKKKKHEIKKRTKLTNVHLLKLFQNFKDGDSSR